MTELNASSPGPASGSLRELRLLVAIASYGERNRPLLERVIACYRAMPFQVDIVVLSEAPKQLGPGVRVQVGLPSSNPWSLPFAHKQLFADHLDDYDLFAYSEDDIALTADNVAALVELTPALASDEIAGFLRYEIDARGRRSLPDAHGPFRWLPRSAHRRGRHVVAEYTNEHAAFFLLTREQLRRAIASGGFLRAPYAGRYDMLCTAATDPYTSCGFRKVIAVSSLDRFLVHHLSNRYAGAVGLALDDFRRQTEAVAEVAEGRRTTAGLLDGLHAAAADDATGPDYYEEPDPDVLALVPATATDILCVGTGHGALELALAARGMRVTALPFDAIIGARLGAAGIRVIPGRFLDTRRELAAERFDCVIVAPLLHRLRAPAEFVHACATLLRGDGALVLRGPNGDYAPALVQRLRRRLSRRPAAAPALRFPEVRHCLQAAGLQPSRVAWQEAGSTMPVSGAKHRPHVLVRWAKSLWPAIRSAMLSFDRGLRARARGARAGYGGIGRFAGRCWVVQARPRPSPSRLDAQPAFRPAHAPIPSVEAR